jgi:hypothetical protein
LTAKEGKTGTNKKDSAVAHLVAATIKFNTPLHKTVIFLPQIMPIAMRPLQQLFKNN